MKSRWSMYWLFAVVALLLQHSKAAWVLETQIGLDYQNFVDWQATRQEPTALVAPSATTLYAATRWEQAGAWYGHILKWTSAAGWSEVPNSYMFLGDSTEDRKVVSLSLVGNYLYVAGNFMQVGLTGINAENLGKLDVNTGSWQAYNNNLRAYGVITQMKTAGWGGGMSGSRTYLYVVGKPGLTFPTAGAGMIARGYEYNPGSWSWETMNGGVLNTGTPYSGINALEVNSSYSWDSTYGYRHLVHVGGEFIRAGGGSVVATNLAVWNEMYGSWSGFGTAGRGVTFQQEDDTCALIASAHGRVTALAGVGGSSGGTVYVAGGGFNKVANTAYRRTDSNTAPCGRYSYLNLARVTSGFSLGVWDKAAFGYMADGFLELESIATTGSNTFIAAGRGLILGPLGWEPDPLAIPPSVPAYRINGTTWEPIDAAAVPGGGMPSTREYLRVTTGGSTAAFFIITDPTSLCGYSIRRYRQ